MPSTACHILMPLDIARTKEPNCSDTKSMNILINIGVGRIRILGGGGGQGLEYLWGGGAGGPNSQQTHDVTSTPCAYKGFNKSVPNNYISHLKI